MVLAASTAGHQPALCQLLILAFPAQLFKSELLLGQAGKVQPFKMTAGVLLFLGFLCFFQWFFDAALGVVLRQADFHSMSFQLWFAVCLRPSFYIRGNSFLPERTGKCLSLSCVWLCESMTVARQAPRSMEFSRQEYWSGLHNPEEPPNPGIEPQSLALQAGKPPGKPFLPDLALEKQSPFVSALCLGFVIPWAGCPVQGLSYDSSQEASGSFGKMVSCSSPWTSQDSIDTYADETPSRGPCVSILLGASLHSNQHLILIACVYGSIVFWVFFWQHQLTAISYITQACPLSFMNSGLCLMST